MARPKATPEQRTEIRRGIQRAAAEIYRADGISAISARAVAKKAGVSVGTIYAYFGDLPGLMQSLWTGRVERQNDLFKAVAAEHSDPVERLRALMVSYLRFGVENPDLYRGVFLFVRPESLDRGDTTPFTSFVFPALLIEAIGEGQAADRLVERDPAELAQTLWSALHGCLALPANLDRLGFASAEEMTAPMVDALLRGVCSRGG
ncbi:MAG: TetR/AcrR family transcriptional regulator [Pseudomonadota bacterium]